MDGKDGSEYRLWRQPLADGEVTMLYTVLHPRPTTRVRVVPFPRPRRLDVWGSSTGAPEAIVGGFDSDGGGSTTLVHRGHLLNRPYSNQNQPAPQSRSVVSALAFEGGGVSR